MCSARGYLFYIQLGREAKLNGLKFATDPKQVIFLTP